MGLKGRYCVVFLVLAVCLLSSFIAAKEDPELKTCKHQCRQQRQFGERQRQQCETQCEEYIKEKQRRERGRYGDDEGRWELRRDPQREGERENPYVFTDDEFQTVFQNEFGRERVLPRFNKISNLLKGIENFRVEIFEFKPSTFMLPKYLDADEFFFVVNGRGTITLVSPNNRESFNIEEGHIMKVPAGSNVYYYVHWALKSLLLGGMTNFHYNTRTTKIAVVTSGQGRFEMACPHINQQQSGPVHYEKVSADLKRGTVFVVPAGHPFVALASREKNLEVICFEVNAEGNEKVAFAGKKSIFKQFENEAKELAFDEKAEAVDQLLGKQDGDFFFQGPRRGQEQGGRAEE